MLASLVGCSNSPTGVVVDSFRELVDNETYYVLRDLVSGERHTIQSGSALPFQMGDEVSCQLDKQGMAVIEKITKVHTP